MTEPEVPKTGDMPKSQYPDSKAGRRLREQSREAIEGTARKRGEFARGEKRQGDGV